MQRLATPELLDSDSGSPAEISASLSDLRRINRWFGGVSTTTSMMRRVANKTGRSALTVLEVAAGSGDVPRGVTVNLRANAVQLKTTLLDRSRAHLPHGGDRTSAVVGDALALPFANASFEVVSCCLFTHHLSPEELGRFVQEALRVCRVAVLINDLIRDPVHLALVYAGWPLYRSRLTRHDGPASVRAAYTIAEMLDCLKQTSAREVVVGRHYLFRMGVVVWK
ncbi:MAG TPA: methyltransferase domain-containing protein [Terriglobales bacterium]|jgi:ubiquinone/menaquinone biosynthesis C-methylase UbiE|nr:methyltransferase domain-containing protein [Terriglobales bacterium]